MKSVIIFDEVKSNDIHLTTNFVESVVKNSNMINLSLALREAYSFVSSGVTVSSFLFEPLNLMWSVNIFPTICWHKNLEEPTYVVEQVEKWGEKKVIELFYNFIGHKNLTQTVKFEEQYLRNNTSILLMVLFWQG